MQPTNFELDGEKYQLLPHTGFEALDLYRKVNDAIGGIIDAPSVPGNENQRGFSALSRTFNSYDKDEFKELVEMTLKNVTVVTPGKKNFALSDVDTISNHFTGRWGKMYDLMFEVWNIEKMLPFDLAPLSGSETKETDS